MARLLQWNITQSAELSLTVFLFQNEASKHHLLAHLYRNSFATSHSAYYLGQIRHQATAMHELLEHLFYFASAMHRNGACY
mmetsp:Transcript_61180/g.115602  ORF Transcript_61180/g.115602 Transcript_61180/m.115602 type:complete len:81 (+) Transcript_61180:199-441(+)